MHIVHVRVNYISVTCNDIRAAQLWVMKNRECKVLAYVMRLEVFLIHRIAGMIHLNYLIKKGILEIR